MVNFVGRRQELATLTRELQKVAAGVGGERPGRCVMLRGRRRVGKSRLVERFAERSGAPFLFYAATGASPRDDLARLARDAQASTLPLAQLVAAARPESWDAAFDVLAAALPADRPSVLVIDEVPYLMDADGAFEGMLQRAWDRVLETKPVLLVLIGSDLSMMEALNSYGRPFHQRGREMVLGPLNPAEVGRMLGLEPADAFDTALVTGGLPLICAEWPQSAGLWDFLDGALSDPVSALLVSAERSLAAEFPPQAQARRVLAAIGSGERNGPAGAAGPSSPLSARPWRGPCPMTGCPRPPRWAATGPVPTTSRSTSSGRTALPSPRNCSSSASSHGWSSRPSTGTTWRLSIGTGPPSPANAFPSWRSHAAESTIRGSMPPTAPAIC
jgi:hypothetical protein